EVASRARVERQERLDDRPQVRVHGDGFDGDLGPVAVEHVGDRAAPVGAAAGERLVEDQAERVVVDAGGGRLARGHLGGGVLGGAVGGRRGGGGRAGDAEVDELDRIGADEHE